MTFVRHGLAKQDRPKHFGSKIFIPSYSEDKLLDPKRAIYYYLKRTESLRNSDDSVENRLFLAVNEPHRPVKTQTISSWIVNTIKCAYNEKGKFRAHSTRALGPSWALFNGASVKSIMDTADWSKESTFTRFYLKVSVNSNFLTFIKKKKKKERKKKRKKKKIDSCFKCTVLCNFFELYSVV